MGGGLHLLSTNFPNTRGGESISFALLDQNCPTLSIISSSSLSSILCIHHCWHVITCFFTTFLTEQQCLLSFFDIATILYFKISFYISTFPTISSLNLSMKSEMSRNMSKFRRIITIIWKFQLNPTSTIHYILYRSFDLLYKTDCLYGDIRNFDFSSQKCLLFIFRVFVDLMLKLRLMSNFEKQTKILRVMRYMKQKCDRLISVVTRIHLIDLAQCHGVHA